MLGLLAQPEAMGALIPVPGWYVLSVLLAPTGYVVQDVVGDAMTVEPSPTVDGNGNPLAPEAKRLMHATPQTLGRVAIIGGGVFVDGDGARPHPPFRGHRPGQARPPP